MRRRNFIAALFAPLMPGPMVAAPLVSLPAVCATDYPWLADPTGETDATAAINACYRYCKANGRGLHLPKGKYLMAGVVSLG